MYKVVGGIVLLFGVLLGGVMFELAQKEILFARPAGSFPYGMMLFFPCVFIFFFGMILDYGFLPEDFPNRRAWGWALFLMNIGAAITYFFSVVVPRETRDTVPGIKRERYVWRYLFRLVFGVICSLAFILGATLYSDLNPSAERFRFVASIGGFSGLVLFFWMLSQHVSPFSDTKVKNGRLWSWVLVLTNIIGALLYFYIVYFPMQVSKVRRLA